MTTITPGDGDHRHGTLNGYINLKCRCGECRRANAERVKAYRERTGYQYQLRYNATQRWAYRQLAERHPVEFKQLMRQALMAYDQGTTA